LNPFFGGRVYIITLVCVRLHLLSLGAVAVHAAVGGLPAGLPSHPAPHLYGQARLCAPLHGAAKLLPTGFWTEQRDRAGEGGRERDRERDRERERAGWRNSQYIALKCVLCFRITYSRLIVDIAFSLITRSLIEVINRKITLPLYGNSTNNIMHRILSATKALQLPCDHLAKRFIKHKVPYYSIYRNIFF
jgi:hypothetical protein